MQLLLCSSGETGHELQRSITNRLNSRTFFPFRPAYRWLSQRVRIGTISIMWIPYMEALADALIP